MEIREMQEVQTDRTERTCVSCKNWKPRESGQMARLHFAICERNPKWKFFPPQSGCDKHQEAPQDVVRARKAWLGEA